LGYIESAKQKLAEVKARQMVQQGETERSESYSAEALVYLERMERAYEFFLDGVFGSAHLGFVFWLS
jgi:hypothetical protein